MIRSWLYYAIGIGLSISPILSYATAPDKVLTVNPSLPTSPTNFHTIQAAIDTFQGSNALYTEIDISPGTYVENIQLEQTSASANQQARNYDLLETQPTTTFFHGLQINGDMRPCFPQYQNGYELVANSTVTGVFTLETSVPGVGPYPVLIAGYGPRPATNTGPLPAQIANPITGNPPPLSNSFNGGFAVMLRGAGLTFAAKSKEAQDAGAGGVIVVDNSSVGTQQATGIDPTIVIPTWTISNTFGTALINAINANPNMTITLVPPTTFYNPPIGTNFGLVTLSHPNQDFTKIQVTVSEPLPIVDPSLPRGVSPVLEQPIFDDPRLALVAGDKIILTESDVFGSRARTVFTVASLSGNVITLTTPVNPTRIDITKKGSSLTFLPNVKIVPAVGDRPIFRVQEIGLSMTGIWMDTNASIVSPLPLTQNAFELSGVQGFLANIIITDTHQNAINGGAFIFTNATNIQQIDGWRSSGKNRRLSSIGWYSGFSVDKQSSLTGAMLFATNARAGSLLTIGNGSTVSVASVILMGNQASLQPGSSGLNMGSLASLSSPSLLTVTDIYGTGIQTGAINCASFRLERIYKPAGGPNNADALYIGSKSVFEVDPVALYTDGQPISLIRDTSLIQDCFNIDPNALISGGTIPNVGIFVDADGTFISHKNLKFAHNSRDYLTVQDNQFLTPGWERTPGNIFPIQKNGKLNSVFQFQELKEKNLKLSLDPSEQFQDRGLYFNSYSIGKTFTLTSTNASWHTLKLTKGHFFGTKYTALRFKPTKGASVTFKVLNPKQVQVLGANNVEFFYEEAPRKAKKN